MGLTDDDWHFELYSEDKISLELIKKKYARWLGVNYYPEHDMMVKARAELIRC